MLTISEQAKVVEKWPHIGALYTRKRVFLMML